MLKISNKYRFGAKSEKVKEQLVKGMANLFDEAEATQAVEEHLAQQEASVSFSIEVSSENSWPLSLIIVLDLKLP